MFFPLYLLKITELNENLLVFFISCSNIFLQKYQYMNFIRALWGINRKRPLWRRSITYYHIGNEKLHKTFAGQWRMEPNIEKKLDPKARASPNRLGNFFLIWRHYARERRAAKKKEKVHFFFFCFRHLFYCCAFAF